ncbi:unnamed protein product [Cercopithifilaria johnstoni]|uniref:Uncharacterized protein n=1 Tax=Cercopithifilaria johnstoni TaxID=2874296 RepID=A0A8J2M2F0_9BILA|nr:unnamed protein product [Cercopithifilaria johnstoni]
MPRTGRQTGLISGSQPKTRSVRLTKPTRMGNSRAVHHKAVCYDVLPEIRSVREGRIRFGSVAPLLSHRAKVLAMKGHYNDYSDDEEDDSDEDSFTEDDYDDVLHYYDRHHQSYDRHRVPIHVKKDYDEYEDELIPSSSLSSYPISTSELFRRRPQPKSYKTHKSATTNSVAIKSAKTKLKKTTTRCNPKNKNKKTKTTLGGALRSGPITRSR